MKRALWIAFAVTGVSLLMAGCSERPQVVQYKQGSYQGKPDTAPYANAPFNGNQQSWESAIRTRNQTQNEYKRTN